MKTGNRKVLKVITLVLSVFVLFNIFWYAWRDMKYDSYINEMEENELSSWIVPRYKHVDDEGYDYSVKCPDYLSFTGNMSVGLPSLDNNPFTDFLVIWPKVFGGYEYGASLTVDGVNYQIMINEDGSAVDSQYSEIAAMSKETIDLLLHKANEKWDLK
ncbi:MAG: hypothetical protein IJ115_00675 [Erysipelotrichaceae bacterium]|nr:hypothetical protein [Erysipelotrichaceae bacterium]